MVTSTNRVVARSSAWSYCCVIVNPMRICRTSTILCMCMRMSVLCVCVCLRVCMHVCLCDVHTIQIHACLLIAHYVSPICAVCCLVNVVVLCASCACSLIACLQFRAKCVSLLNFLHLSSVWRSKSRCERHKAKQENCWREYDDDDEDFV